MINAFYQERKLDCRIIYNTDAIAPNHMILPKWHTKYNTHNKIVK